MKAYIGLDWQPREIFEFLLNFFFTIYKVYYNFKVCNCKNNYKKWQRKEVNYAIDVEKKAVFLKKRV